MWDSKTLLCCSRWTGIYLVDLHTGEHRRPPFDCGPEITTMMTDSRKRIWIAPYSGGLRCYSYDGNLLLWGGAHGIPIGFISMTP